MIQGTGRTNGRPKTDSSPDVNRLFDTWAPAEDTMVTVKFQQELAKCKIGN